MEFIYSFVCGSFCGTFDRYVFFHLHYIPRVFRTPALCFCGQLEETLAFYANSECAVVRETSYLRERERESSYLHEAGATLHFEGGYEIFILYYKL